MPSAFQWHIEPAAWKSEIDGPVVVSSGARNDYFHDPATGAQVASAPCALMDIDEPSFIFSSEVLLSASETFDARVLFVRASTDLWAKFCLELSPTHQPTIVSVVTRGVFDDCNSIALESAHVHLRVAKTP
ncbi:MAG: DUF1349 domain-containing protein, partial [Dokdonella sp.]